METKVCLSEERIREMVKKQGKSLRVFAFEAGMGPERLSSILTGLRYGYGITMETATRIAKGLDVSLQELMSNEKNNEEGGN